MEVLNEAIDFLHKDIDPQELEITMRVLTHMCQTLNTPQTSSKESE
jgi:hypothetical protein